MLNAVKKNIWKKHYNRTVTPSSEPTVTHQLQILILILTLTLTLTLTLNPNPNLSLNRVRLKGADNADNADEGN